MCQPSYDLEKVQTGISKMNELMLSKKVIYLSGRSDFLLFRELQGERPSIGKWIMD